MLNTLQGRALLKNFDLNGRYAEFEKLCVRSCFFRDINKKKINEKYGNANRISEGPAGMASFNYYPKFVIKQTLLIFRSGVLSSCSSPSTVPRDLLKWLFARVLEHFKGKVLIGITNAVYVLPCIRRISLEQIQHTCHMMFKATMNKPGPSSSTLRECLGD